MYLPKALILSGQIKIRIHKEIKFKFLREMLVLVTFALGTNEIITSMSPFNFANILDFREREKIH